MTHAHDTLRPDADEMIRVKHEIDSRLIASLQYLVDELEPLPVAFAAACRANLARLSPGLIDPALHGLHAEMRAAALNEDRATFDGKRQHFGDWSFPLTRSANAAFPAIRSLAEGDYDPIRRQILTAGFADDVGLTTRLVAPPPEVLASESQNLTRACNILTVLTPDWGSEFAHLVSEVVLATNADPMPGRNFAGGSVFDLFGALLVNPCYRTDIAHYLMTLIHESSHLRLFCHHLDDEVVLNDDVARYQSPLRRQPRPMEGVFHAMWVSARMAVFGHDLLAQTGRHDLMTDPELQQMRDQVEAATRAFRDGFGVVREHGVLTDLGERLLSDAGRAVGAIEALV